MKGKNKEMPAAIEPQNCKNCNTLFSGNFCPECGQSLKELQRPFSTLFSDAMGTFFSIDTRIFRTIPTFLFHPGKLESHFMEGKRARYIPPFRLYIFISFFFFLIINTQTKNSIHILKEKEGGQLENVLKADYTATKEYSTEEHLGKTKQQLTASDAKIIKRVKKIFSFPEVYIGKLYQYLSWSLFVLMPLFGLILFWFFRKHHKYYIGHLLFAINAHSFTFVILMLIAGLSMIFPANSDTLSILLILIPIYILRATTRFYRISITKGLFRLIPSAMIYFIFLALTVFSAIYFSFASVK